MKTKEGEGENISMSYQKIWKELGRNTQEQWNKLLNKKEELFKEESMAQIIDQFHTSLFSSNPQYLFHSSPHINKNNPPDSYFFNFIKWLLLKTNNFQQILLTDLPLKIDESITLLTKFNCPKAILPYIYIAFRFIIELYYRFQEIDNIKDKLKMEANLNYICFPYNFREINQIYTDRQSFWEFVRAKPLLKLNNFLCDNYEIFDQQFMADFCDNNCILSTNLIKFAQFPMLQRFIISKIISLKIDKTTQIMTNNYFLNKFHELSLQKLLAKDQINKDKVSQQFCLTSSINHKNLNKIIAFFYLMPPELSPFSKYSIFPYQNSNLTNIFFRIAKQGYWQSCQKSEFLEIYYLLNEAAVEWLCIPSNIYKQFQHTFSSWNETQFIYIYSQISQIYRGIQRKGQLMIIQSGYEYFWKVKLGSAAFIKWSLLVKQQSFIESYTDIVAQYQNDSCKRQWRIEILHRSMIMNYLSHEWMFLSAPSIKKLINIVQSRLQVQQSKYLSLLEKGSDEAELKQLNIEKQLRLCGYCGQEILNYFILVNKWVYCLDCIDSATVPKQHINIKYCYIRKPDKIRIFLNQLLLSKENSANATNLSDLAQAEIINLNGSYNPIKEIQNNSSEKDNLLQSQQITNQFIFKKDDISLLLFQKRSSFFSSQPLFKHLALKQVQSEIQRTQMAKLMKIMVNIILSQDEKKSLQSQIYQFYSQSNYVLTALNALRNSQH